MPEESGGGGKASGRGSNGSATQFLAQFRRKTEEYLTYGAEPDNCGIQVGSFADLAATPAPDLEWIASNLIPSRTVTLFAGDGGSGKSLLAMQLMLAMATGTLWIGTNVLQGRSFGFFCEDDQDTLHRRVRALTARLKLDPDRCRDASYVSRAGEDAVLYGPSVEDPRVTEFTRLHFAFANHLRAWKPKLAVIDTAADVYNANENVRAQVRDFVRALRDLALDLNCAILLCAHPSIAGLVSGRGFSGSTAWNNSVRSRLYLTKSEDDEDVRVLQSMKQNYAAKVDDIRLRYESGAFVPAGDEIGTVANLKRNAAETSILDLIDQAAKKNRPLREFKQAGMALYLPSVAAQEIKGMTLKRAEKIMGDLLRRGLIETAVVDAKAKRAGLVRLDQGPLFKEAAE